MYFRGPVGIISAATGLAVEQAAAYLGEVGARAVVGVFELDQAAFPASVTDALPFGFRDQSPLPRWRVPKHSASV